MAITLAESTRRGGGFIANGYSADWTNCEIIKAAPGSGKAIVVERLYFTALAAEIVSVGEGEAANAVVTVKVGPYNIAATWMDYLEFGDGWQLAEDTELTAELAGAGACTIIAVGKVIDV